MNGGFAGTRFAEKLPAAGHPSGPFSWEDCHAMSVWLIQSSGKAAKAGTGQPVIAPDAVDPAQRTGTLEVQAMGGAQPLAPGMGYAHAIALVDDNGTTKFIEWSDTVEFV